jgi:uncharacterized protein DUF7025
MASENIQDQDARSQADDDSYSIIEKLADAMRIEDDVQIKPEERAKLVRDLFEGPRRCECCINWVEELPPNVDLDGSDDDEGPHPLILRRRILPGETKESKTKAEVHSIEIRSPEVREVLFKVFEGLDGLHPDVKYLIFLAPFCQFFWRWEAFEKAVAEQPDESVKAILLQLRAIVKRELADAFAVSKELTSNGVITFRYLWTIFPPGELIYTNFFDSEERFLVLLNSRMEDPRRPRAGPPTYILNLRYIDWDGYGFGYTPHPGRIGQFKGTRKINSLFMYPAKYMKDQTAARDRCIARGIKFRDLTGIQYKSYKARSQRQPVNKNGKAHSSPKTLDRRIVLDAKGHPGRVYCEDLKEPEKLNYTTGIITQTPVDATPPGGHRPLDASQDVDGVRRRRQPIVEPYGESDYDERPVKVIRGPRRLPPPQPMPGRWRRSSSMDSISTVASSKSPLPNIFK